jgi:hypothetical protein
MLVKWIGYLHGHFQVPSKVFIQPQFGDVHEVDEKAIIQSIQNDAGAGNHILADFVRFAHMFLVVPKELGGLRRVGGWKQVFEAEGHVGVMPTGKILFEILPIVDHLDRSAEKQEDLPVVVDERSFAQST